MKQMQKTVPHNLQQHGAAMLLFLLSMLVGIAAVTMIFFSNNRLNTQVDIKTSNRLATAKRAVLDYITANYTLVDIGDYGILPCPDSNTANIQGESDSNCLNSHVNAIGHLPWKTLGIAPLKDQSGQCLWYVVSGIAKTADPDSMANGLINVIAAEGQTRLTNPSNPAVAAIIAPNKALEYQTTRPAIPDSSACELSYNPALYLDRTTTSTSPTITINNAQLNGVVDTSDNFITANNTTENTIPPYNTGNPSPHNDRIIYITRNELLNAITKGNRSQTQQQTTPQLDSSTAQITFENNIGDFSVATGNALVAVNGSGTTTALNITTDPANNSTNGGTDYQYACRWYGNVFELENRTLRTFFAFHLSEDQSSNSGARCSGFTFTIKPGPSISCGLSGANLGFAGMTDIGSQSFAVEYDINNSPTKNDPATYNHIAIVHQSDNTHNTTINSGCPGSACYGKGNGSQQDITWLEDATNHYARIEIITGFQDNTCTAGQENSGGNYLLLKTWVDCNGSDCENLGKLDQNYNEATNSPVVSECFILPAQMRGDPSSSIENGIRFGITAAVGGCTTTPPYTEITISDFGLTIE